MNRLEIKGEIIEVLSILALLNYGPKKVHSSWLSGLVLGFLQG